MGAVLCCFNLDMKITLKSHPRYSEWMKEFKALMFTDDEILRLFRVFTRIDNDNSGTIDISELFVSLEIDPNPFNHRIFSIFDDDNSGGIDFREFVLCVWNYCTLSHTTLVFFAFDMYDRDSSGSITSEEIKRMLKELYGSNYRNNPRALEVEKQLSDVEARGSIDVEYFNIFCKSHPALLFPAHQMRDRLGNVVMGRSFWEKKGESRIKMSDGEFVPMKEFLRTHFADGHYNALLNRTIAEDVKALRDKTGTVAMRRQNSGMVSNSSPSLVIASQGSGSKLSSVPEPIADCARSRSKILPTNSDDTLSVSKNLGSGISRAKSRDSRGGNTRAAWRTGGSPDGSPSPNNSHARAGTDAVHDFQMEEVMGDIRRDAGSEEKNSSIQHATGGGNIKNDQRSSKRVNFALTKQKTNSKISGGGGSGTSRNASTGSSNLPWIEKQISHIAKENKDQNLRQHSSPHFQDEALTMRVKSDQRVYRQSSMPTIVKTAPSAGPSRSGFGIA